MLEQGIIVHKIVAAFFVFLMGSFTLATAPKGFSYEYALENSWTSLTPLPIAYEVSLGAAIVDGKIYFFAGRAFGGSVAAQYDPDRNNWTKITHPPMDNNWAKVVAYQNKIYVIGGSAKTPTQVYDPSTDTWENKAPIPETIYGHQPNVVDNKIYVISGGSPAFIGLVKASNTTYVYDPATDSWYKMAPIPEPVIAYASAVMDDKIFIIGGGPTTNVPHNATNIVQIFDPKLNQWTSGTPIPTGVVAAGSCSTHGLSAYKRIYVIGGEFKYSGGGLSSDWFSFGTDLNQVYDPYTDSWSSAAPLSGVRWDLSLVNVNDSIYAIGGTISRYSNSYGTFPNCTGATEKYVPIGYGHPYDDSSAAFVPKPIVTLLSPENMTYNSSSISLVFTVNKPTSWLGYSLDGQDTVTINGNITFSSLANGFHNVTVYANSSSSSMGKSETRSFAVEVPDEAALPIEPFPWLPVAAVSVAVAVVVVATAIVYMKKRRS